MLRWDEHVCRRLARPAYSNLPDDEHGAKLTDFLLTFAAGRAQARYENGLIVPRSLFHSRIALLLLAEDGRTRRLVRTPYGYGSAMEILVPKHEEKGPWGALWRPRDGTP
ncbi:hypothetical protein PX554_19790 [Sphingomonas sp. H39-1-10]|uniref:hypothetical protein n=1 Tax=Sphingomonas pollutisoli TaxID=3030829 RepID=UPI0023B92D06|nr:hypothetical protein [Sphingomonas pollutisoli]MDF0490374.1 hypothetical protein [Sphingomonas pollutisoli]